MYWVKKLNSLDYLVISLLTRKVSLAETETAEEASGQEHKWNRKHETSPGSMQELSRAKREILVLVR